MNNNEITEQLIIYNGLQKINEINQHPELLDHQKTFKVSEVFEDIENVLKIIMYHQVSDEELKEFT